MHARAFSRAPPHRNVGMLILMAVSNSDSNIRHVCSTLRPYQILKFDEDSPMWIQRSMQILSADMKAEANI